MNQRDLRAALERLAEEVDLAGPLPSLQHAFDRVAALAAPSADGLDVERLTRAIDSLTVVAFPSKGSQDVAKAIAAAYLRQPSRESGEEG